MFISYGRKALAMTAFCFYTFLKQNSPIVFDEAADLVLIVL
jgi:hypothetical protein